MNFETRDDFSHYAFDTDGDSNSFYKSLSTVDLGMAGSCESTGLLHNLNTMTAKQTDTVNGATTNPLRIVQTTGTTLQFTQPSTETLAQEQEQEDWYRSQFGNQSSDWPPSHLMPQPGFSPLLQSIDQPQLPSQLTHQPPHIAPQPLMTQQPLQMNGSNDFEDFISKLLQNESSFSEIDNEGQINQNQVMNADREDPNNAVGYNQAFSSCTTRELTASNMETQLPDQSHENIPVLEQFMDLNQLMPRHGSIPQLLDDSGFSKTLAHSDNSQEDSADSMDVEETTSADRMESTREMAKARRKGRRYRSRHSESSIDPNSPAFKQYLDTLGHKDRQRELNRQAAKRHRDKKFKHQQELEVKAESLREEQVRLVAERNRLQAEQKKLLNSGCVYNRTKHFHRCGQ